MNLFEQTEKDLKIFHQLAGNFWKTVPDDAWEKRTGSREKDWTLHQTLAHVLSVATLFNKATDAAIRGEDLNFRDVAGREALAAWNAEEIARLSQAPPNALIVRLLQEWRSAGDKARSLTAETAEKTYSLPIYNRASSALDFIEWQLSHAGIVHAAQVTRPLGKSPLWTDYDADFMQRMIWRFARLWSVTYWPEYGSEQTKIMNFHIAGAGGGSWHLIMARDGGKAGEGAAENADYEFYYESADLFFGIFTLEVPILEAFSSGKARLVGDIGEALNVLRLFGPNRPRI
jgi:Mycothiol maleylpyruvate isomerase N-terminal domain